MTQQNTQETPRVIRNTLMNSVYKNATPTIIIALLAFIAAELALPPKLKPAYLFGWSTTGVEVGSLDREREAKAESERVIGLANAEVQIKIKEMETKFQIELARQQSEFQKQVIAMQDAANRASQKEQMANNVHANVAQIAAKQVDDTSSVRKGIANLADGACELAPFFGDPLGACDYSSKIRDDLQDELFATVELITRPTGDFTNGLVDPSQLMVGERLQNDFGRTAPDRFAKNENTPQPPSIKPVKRKEQQPTPIDLTQKTNEELVALRNAVSTSNQLSVSQRNLISDIDRERILRGNATSSNPSGEGL